MSDHCEVENDTSSAISEFSGSGGNLSGRSSPQSPKKVVIDDDDGHGDSHVKSASSEDKDPETSLGNDEKSGSEHSSEQFVKPHAPLEVQAKPQIVKKTVPTPPPVTSERSRRYKGDRSVIRTSDGYVPAYPERAKEFMERDCSNVNFASAVPIVPIDFRPVLEKMELVTALEKRLCEMEKMLLKRIDTMDNMLKMRIPEFSKSIESVKRKTSDLQERAAKIPRTSPNKGSNSKTKSKKRKMEDVESFTSKMDKDLTTLWDQQHANRGPAVACVYCGQIGHYGGDCGSVRTIASRVMVLQRQNPSGFCKLCLGGHAEYIVCPAQSKPCFHCGEVGRHHSSLCPKRFEAL